MEFVITPGFCPDEHDQVAALYWQAFGAKLGRVLGPHKRAKAFLCQVMDPEFALVARNAHGEILGIAGFKTAQGALVGGEYSDLKQFYGDWGGLWRGLLLTVLERDVEPDILLMDGICVEATARGLGLGTALLETIKQHARSLGKSAVRLDVINTNPRAKALYMRCGFEATKTENTGLFRFVFRFDSATQMLWHTTKA
ncbi:hypothetical protein ROLI_006690 [Roseobacter fucihabitans]|uniref:N-acetyltransferase domain-containing protein n=1 Tax=Roseobacter fucihabitans TaxID=1537242 RepID=A0ABZ2BNN5_9RHOB|nr:GNAT family N-acetyltransferase [Roseobacter litoralis]MBC6966288.1 Mycothiol acetyltransferase [Roseobacter litoralis]